MSVNETIGSLISTKEFRIDQKEPENLQNLRQTNWDRFLSLPHETDPNMLNFVRPKLLESLIISAKDPLVVNPVQENIKTSDTGSELCISPLKIGMAFSKNITQKFKNKIHFQAISSIIESSPTHILNLLGALTDFYSHDKLMALILASFQWGSFLHIADNIDIVEPITIKYENKSVAVPGIHIINIGSNINATIDLLYDSYDMINDHSLTYLVVGTNSHVNVLVREKGKPERKTNRSFIATIGKDASLNFTQLQVNGKYTRQRAEFYFTDEGGDLVELACLRGFKQQHFDYYSSVYHKTARCTSTTIARGVNDDESTTFFKGKVDIGAQGFNVNTDLSLRGLLLSKKARFHSIPAMEVINSNVVATHGAAVSKIDPEQIFYFQTRGIDQKEAEHMIASGYFEPAVSKIRSSYLQDKARSIMNSAVDEQFSVV